MTYRSAATALAVVGLALAAGTAPAWATETNRWPFWVQPSEPTAARSEQSALGPFYFRQASAQSGLAEGLRPFYDQTRSPDGTQTSASLLYPLWHGEHDQHTATTSWSLFNLLNCERDPATATDRFDAWPFYFSRDTGAPETSYRAVFPLYGDVPQRFGQDHLQWVLFPLYGRFEKHGEVTTTLPWPFLKVVSGEGHRGIEVWPLGGHREETGVDSDTFALWPLYYRKQTGLDTPQPSLQTGLLPFYALDRSPGYQSETYGWPFFGYVDRTEPYRYHATHYFWPLLVQGRGDERRVNRWAPIYSHSTIKGYDKTWVLWPLWRDANWDDAQLHHEKRQLLFFLFNQTRQTRRQQPDGPAATKVHLWPLLSAWDNGAGQKQVQLLSPFEVFFPQNDRIRRLWTPLFALYRFNQTAPGETRHELLWDAVTWRASAAEQQTEFHLGPLAGYTTAPAEKRLSFFGGWVGLRQQPGRRGWRPFFGKPSPLPVTSSPSTSSP